MCDVFEPIYECGKRAYEDPIPFDLGQAAGGWDVQLVVLIVVGCVTFVVVMALSSEYILPFARIETGSWTKRIQTWMSRMQEMSNTRLCTVTAEAIAEGYVISL